MCGVSQVKKVEQGAGLGRGITCVKAQRQDSVAHLDNWKKLLVANSYTFFKFPFKPIPSPSGAVPSYPRLSSFPVLKALQCLFLGDSLH